MKTAEKIKGQFLFAAPSGQGTGIANHYFIFISDAGFGFFGFSVQRSSGGNFPPRSQ